jgi:methylmalonyl-CoA mutase C-terminal domain/subunit
MAERKIRVLIAKMGLDGHDTGAKVVARMLKDAGMEVIYLGPHNLAADIVSAALDEDVDVIGLSFLSGQHLVNTAKLMRLLEEKDLRCMVVVGGIIPKEDIPALRALGVAGVFGPGATAGQIVECIQNGLAAVAVT